MQDSIQREIEIAAPPGRVWTALTDGKQFGAWFGVSLGGPFVAGETVIARSVAGDCEGEEIELVIETIEPERRFVWLWHPAAMEPGVDYADEPMTRVEFVLEPTEAGTLVQVTETGFSKIWERRRESAFGMNSRGWDAQIRNIKTYVEG